MEVLLGPGMGLKRELFFASVNLVAASELRLQANPSPLSASSCVASFGIHPARLPSQSWQNHLQTYFFCVSVVLVWLF